MQYLKQGEDVITCHSLLYPHTYYLYWENINVIYVKLHAKAGLVITEHADCMCNELSREIAKVLEKYTNLSLCINEMNCTVIMSGTEHLTKLLDLSANIINAIDIPIKMAIYTVVTYTMYSIRQHYLPEYAREHTTN